tara:strand:- start:322 stop:1074 length:753 start_codon:yes stop_codon:yes gene_type:complete
MIVQRDWSKFPLQVLSYGGGTQSTAMLIMIDNGSLTKPDIVIHADTGSELPETIEFIKTAKDFTENKLGIPFVIVKSHLGSLHEWYLEKNAMPIIGIRSCTDKWKIRPQRRYMREIVGNGKGKVLAECWLGITTDEERRRTDSNVKWCGLKYPLLDDYPISREGCISLNKKQGWNVIKSGCHCCPYQGGKTWLQLKTDHPDLFAISVEMEKRKIKVRGGKRGLYQNILLSDLTNITLPESACDSHAGCFI